MTLIVFIATIALGIYALACKMVCLALLMYIEDTSTIPDKKTLSEYIERAIKKKFHVPK